MKAKIFSIFSVLVMVALIVPTVYAANLTSVKDTLSSSAPEAVANHGIEFTTPTGVADDGSFKLVFATEFDFTPSGDFDADDFDVTIDAAEQTLVDAAPGAGEIQVDLSSIASNTVIFDMASDVSLPAGAVVTVEIGTNATAGATGDSQITNPDTDGAYDVSITTHSDDDGTLDEDSNAGSIDEGTATVYINELVTVTATVQSSLTFTIEGASTGGANCTYQTGTYTPDITTTPTTIAFGLLTADTPKKACQKLSVATNATNGYVTTVEQNNDLTSGGGDTIKDWVGTYAAPSAWPADPFAANPDHGYFGFHPSDTDYSDFDSDLWAGFTSSTPTKYNVATASGPVSGTDGENWVNYQIEVDDLQEAGVYTNTLMYITTATF